MKHHPPPRGLQPLLHIRITWRALNSTDALIPPPKYSHVVGMQCSLDIQILKNAPKWFCWAAKAKSHELRQHNRKSWSCRYKWCLKVFKFFCFLGFFLMFIYFWERERQTQTKREWGRGRERGRHRIRSRLQALSCQHRARCGAQTHELTHHEIMIWGHMSRSQTLNSLNHTGAPFLFFKHSADQINTSTI